MEKFRVILLSSLLLTMVSCGDLFMQDTKDKGMKLSQFAECKLDMDAFSEIFEKNIKSDINCLREKLNMFVQTVATDRPGYASREVLKNFLLKGPIDVDPEVVNIVDSVYDLSHIIIGSEKDYIKNSDIDVLLDFLIYFNAHIRETYQYFVAENELNYDTLTRERNIIFEEFSLIANRLKSIYKSKRSGIDHINTEEFIFNFFKNDQPTLDKIRSLMFLKRVFVGGQKWDLSHLEVSTMLDSIPQLAQIAFDLTKGKYYNFESQQEKTAEIFRKDIEILSDVTYFNRHSNEEVFSVADVIMAINTMDPDLLSIDLTQFPREIEKVKEIFLGVNSSQFLGRELHALYDHAREILSEGIMSYRIYNFEGFKEQLNDPTKSPVHDGGQTFDFSSFPGAITDEEKRYLKNFSLVANNYKFFKGTNKLPFYTYGTYRNPNAIFQILVLEYVIKEAMSYYGYRDDRAHGGFHMILEENSTYPDPTKTVYQAVKDFKWLLKDQGLAVIGRENGGELMAVTNNAVLLSTLFQYQSDGCDKNNICMDVPELTEFAIGLFTAMEIKDFFTDEMVKLCASELDNFNRIEPQCFRDNFINVVRTEITDKNGNGTGLSIADYMPNLNKYFEEMTKDVVSQGKPITESEEYKNFIMETEAFTRVCMYYDDSKQEEVWLKPTDAFAVFAGLFNVESTLNRWDIDQNGKMDYSNKDGINEPLNAFYTTYQGAIKGLIDMSPFLNNLVAKPVFQFLIKYKKAPNTKNVGDLWKLAKIIVSKKARRADADRATISTILKVLGEENAKVPDDEGNTHYFKCSECIDPDTNCQPEYNPADPTEWQ